MVKWLVVEVIGYPDGGKGEQIAGKQCRKACPRQLLENSGQPLAADSLLRCAVWVLRVLPRWARKMVMRIHVLVAGDSNGKERAQDGLLYVASWGQMLIWWVYGVENER